MCDYLPCGTSDIDFDMYFDSEEYTEKQKENLSFVLGLGARFIKFLKEEEENAPDAYDIIDMRHILENIDDELSNAEEFIKN